MNRTLKEAKHRGTEQLGCEPINLQGVRLARVRYAPIATKFSAA